MDPTALMKLLLIAADAKTDEEQARVAWRANDHMWHNVQSYEVWLCRRFNDLCRDAEFPKVKNLWSEEERKEIMEKYGIKHEPEIPSSGSSIAIPPRK